MHAAVRASLLGSLVLGGLVAAVACWPVAPDSAKDQYLGDGSVESTLPEGTILVEGASGDGDDEGGSSGGDGSSGDAEAQAPLVIAPAASPALASGEVFGCRIDSAGNVACWGDDTYGQLGSTPSSTPVSFLQPVDGVTGAVWMATGDRHACAVTTSHAVYCWGLNDAYQLGHAAATSGDQICPGAVAGQTVPCNATPTVVAGISPAVAIAAAGAFTCILTTDGSVQCWGAIQTGAADAGVACGSGAQALGGSCNSAPYTVPGLTGATQLAVAYDHACAVVAAGGVTDAGNQVACWGNNNEGQVSPSACPGSVCVTPIARADLPTTTALAVGNEFTCALGVDGSVRCFGDNSYGELGHTAGSSGDQGSSAGDGGLGIYNPNPVVASAGAVASLVGGGNQATCALTGAGSAECWGNAAVGAGSSSPTVLTGLPVIDALGSFDSSYVCGIAAADGSIWCSTLGTTGAPVEIAAEGAVDGG